MVKKNVLLVRSSSVPLLIGACLVSYLLGRYTASRPFLPDLEPRGASKYDLASTAGEASVIHAPGESHTHPVGPFSAPRTMVGESGNKEFTVAPHQILSWYPRVVHFPNFIDEERRTSIINLANKKLAPSGLAIRKGETRERTKHIRTSSGVFLDADRERSEALKWLQDKIADVTLIPVEHGEPFNVLRYNNLQRYESHYDVFDPEAYGPQESMRIATFLTYLSDVEEGGETVLPLEGKEGLSRTEAEDFSYKDCTTGLAYKPKAGDGLLFFSIFPNGTFDRRSLHGGCPVISGEKWVATKWIRDKFYKVGD